jgi:hypothetical protein
MEELNLTLVNSQKFAVITLLQSERFDPADFEWQTGTQENMMQMALESLSGTQFRYSYTRVQGIFFRLRNTAQSIRQGTNFERWFSRGAD